jgi:hypothetical protein
MDSSMTDGNDCVGNNAFFRVQTCADRRTLMPQVGRAIVPTRGRSDPRPGLWDRASGRGIHRRLMSLRAEHTGPVGGRAATRRPTGEPTQTRDRGGRRQPRETSGSSAPGPRALRDPEPGTLKRRSASARRTRRARWHRACWRHAQWQAGHQRSTASRSMRLLPHTRTRRCDPRFVLDPRLRWGSRSAMYRPAMDRCRDDFPKCRSSVPASVESPWPTSGKPQR